MISISFFGFLRSGCVVSHMTALSQFATTPTRDSIPVQSFDSESGFVFRDGRGLSYRVEWTGQESTLFARLRSGGWSALRAVSSEEELDAMMEMEVSRAEYSLYEYEVEMIGRMFFMVRSISRPEVVHMVDWESNVFGESPACSCEHNRFRKLHCKHLAAVRVFLGLDEIVSRRDAAAQRR